MSEPTTQLATVTPINAPAIKPPAPLTDNIIDALVQGDLAKLSPADRAVYYTGLCERVGIDPAFQPFSYLILNGKLTLYANKSCAEQLRKVHKVSVKVSGRQTINDVYAVTATAMLPDGREDESLGAVSIGNLKGDNLANALMKAETKSKRRVTLSICGLGMLDETEIETIKNAKRVSFEQATQPIPLGYEAPARPPTGPEVKAAYADLRGTRPELPEDVKAWVATWLTGYDGKTTKDQLVVIMAKIMELAAEGVDAPGAAVAPQETAQDATFRPVPTEKPSEYKYDRYGPPPAHNGVTITNKTRGHLMGNVAKLGHTEKRDRLAYAEQNGLTVASYSQLSEEQGQFLAQRAWDDFMATQPCAACNAQPGEAHADGCPEC